MQRVCSKAVEEDAAALQKMRETLRALSPRQTVSKETAGRRFMSAGGDNFRNCGSLEDL